MLGAFLRDVIARNPDELPDVRARRDRVEPARRRLRGDRPKVWEASARADRRAPRAGRAGDRDAVRAPLPGLARGLSADRPARPLQLLRGVHPHRRLDVQPARQVAEGDARDSRGADRSPRSTTCSRSHVWRQDHNGFSHQDPGFIDHVVNKKAEVIRVYLPPDANTLLSVGRPLPAQPATTSTSSSPASSRRSRTCRSRTRRPLHPRASASGMGGQRRRR